MQHGNTFMDTATAPRSRLAYLPISFFAMVMGLSGLTIAWEKAQHVFGVDWGISLPLTLLTSSVFRFPIAAVPQ